MPATPKTETAGGPRHGRRTADASGGGGRGQPRRTAFSTVVLSAAAIALAATADWEHAAAACGRWLFTAAELLSVSDQKVFGPYKRKRIIFYLKKKTYELFAARRFFTETLLDSDCERTIIMYWFYHVCFFFLSF